MPDFIYQARNKTGQVKKGKIQANNEDDLAGILDNKGLVLTKSEEVGKKTAFSLRNILEKFGRVSLLNKISFTRNLQLMIKAGLSITSSLEILVKQTTNKKFKKIILEIKNQVEQGKSFADSLAMYPKVFSQLYVSTIRMAELSGKLEEVLEELAIQMKKDRELINKVTGALIYPIIVLITLVGVVVLMFIFVLPQLVTTLKELEVDLPITTNILIAVSQVIIDYGLFFSIFIVAGIIGLFFYGRTSSGRRNVHIILLKLPIIGEIIKKVNLARFARSESTLLKSGINIVKSLQVTGDVMGNLIYKESMQVATKKIKKGLRLATCLEKYGNIYPPLVTQMLVVGEETGTLDDILKELADFYETEVSRTMDNLSSIIEPVLMIILGIGVAIIAMAIISPIYSLVGSI